MKREQIERGIRGIRTVVLRLRFRRRPHTPRPPFRLRWQAFMTRVLPWWKPPSPPTSAAAAKGLRVPGYRLPPGLLFHRHGAPRHEHVTGIDARDESLQSARFASPKPPVSSNIRYHQGPCGNPGGRMAKIHAPTILPCSWESSITWKIPCSACARWRPSPAKCASSKPRWSMRWRAYAEWGSQRMDSSL